MHESNNGINGSNQWLESMNPINESNQWIEWMNRINGNESMESNQWNRINGIESMNGINGIVSMASNQWNRTQSVSGSTIHVKNFSPCQNECVKNEKSENPRWIFKLLLRFRAGQPHCALHALCVFLCTPLFEPKWEPL